MREPAWRRYLRFWRPNVEADVDDEVRFHIAMRVEELVGRGMTRDEAVAAAHRQFGDVGRVRDGLVEIDRRALRRHGWAEWLSALRQDLRFATRGLRNEPLFAAAVVLTLGLGIGANAAMFGIVDRLLFRPPAHVRDADRVNFLYFERTQQPFGRTTSDVTNYPFLTELRRAVPSLERVAGYSGERVSVGEGADAWQAVGTIVTPDFFSLLGVQPALGRFFIPDEEQPSYDNPGVVLGYGAWRDRFGADSQVIGRTLPIGARRYPIVGVAPRGFTGAELRRVDLWLPIGATANFYIDDWQTNAGSYWLGLVARLRPGVSAERASVEASLVYRRWLALDNKRLARAEIDPTARVMFASVVGVRGGDPERPAEAKVAAWLAALAIVVLVIACANVGNLLLLRAMRRRREVAIRRALGMSQVRFVGQLLVESLFLATLGGASALLATRWVGGPLRALLIPDVAWEGSTVDARVLGVTTAAILGVTLFIALVPALNVGKTDLTAELKSGGRGLSGRRSRTQSALLVVQTALSIALLAGAGLFLKSLQRVRSVDLGFDTHQVLVAQVRFPSETYKAEQISAFYDRALERVRHLPGVERAALGEADPFGSGFGGGLRIPGRDSLPEVSTGGPYFSAVTPEFFTTLGTRVLRGRAFTESDRAGSPPVVVINEALARLYWPGDNPVGRCVVVDDVPGCTRVVGVVETATKYGIREEPRLDFFIPLAQQTGRRRGHALFVRTLGPADRMVGAVRRALQELSPNLPYADVVSLQSRVDPKIRSWRLGATTMTAFALLALILAALGLYSVIAYGVTQRVQEMGIRVALGARDRDVIRLILGDGVRLAGIGILVGGVAAIVLGRLVADLLFDTAPYDPAVIGTSSAVLLSVAVIASFLPAWRASRVDPAIALRVD
jgi:predicted permease